MADIGNVQVSRPLDRVVHGITRTKYHLNFLISTIERDTANSENSNFSMVVTPFCCRRSDRRIVKIVVVDEKSKSIQ